MWPGLMAAFLINGEPRLETLWSKSLFSVYLLLTCLVNTVYLKGPLRVEAGERNGKLNGESNRTSNRERAMENAMERNGKSNARHKTQCREKSK